MRAVIAAILLALPATLAAQSLPVPDAENPRLQSFSWQPDEAVRLMALPQTGLTVMLEPGEVIEQLALDRRGTMDVRVSAERDSFLVIPSRDGAEATLTVTSDRRTYTFIVETGTGLMAAYLVRYAPDAGYATYTAPDLPHGLQPFDDTGQTWTYRLRGDRSVRPAEISDNGSKTQIRFGEGQALPAIFAIGATGKEQVVNGHMRGDVFVIDRIWEELVFRIDKDKATARRSKEPEGA